MESVHINYMARLTKEQIRNWLIFIKYVGKLWTGTTVSGYSEAGAFHCEDCSHLKGAMQGRPYVGPEGKGRCDHQLVQLDPSVPTDSQGRKMVNIEQGCCEFVDSDARGKKNMLLGR